MNSREKDFRGDLEALLTKHKAEIVAVDYGPRFAPQVEVELDGFEDGDNWVDYHEFKL